MSRALALALPLALACGEKDASPADDSGPGDTAPSSHPLVPPGYEYRWDIDGCGDGGNGTAQYVLAEASTDAEGNISITERWYTFYGREWSEDCVDTLTFTGVAMTAADLNNLNASEAEEGYAVVRSVEENNCGYGYEDDREFWYVFDTLTPSGNLNYENAMLVFRYYEGRRGLTAELDYARGVFNPQTEALAPPATYTWEGEDCDD